MINIMWYWNKHLIHLHIMIKLQWSTVQISWKFVKSGKVIKDCRFNSHNIGLAIFLWAFFLKRGHQSLIIPLGEIYFSNVLISSLYQPFYILLLEWSWFLPAAPFLKFRYFSFNYLIVGTFDDFMYKVLTWITTLVGLILSYLYKTEFSKVCLWQFLMM